MGIAELLDAIESELDDLETGLNEECEQEVEHEATVTVSVNGGYDSEHTITIYPDINMSAVSLMEGLPDEFGTIMEKIGEIRVLLDQEPSVEALVTDFDSGVLADALLKRINKEHNEAIAGSTSWSNWQSPYVESLRAMLTLGPICKTKKPEEPIWQQPVMTIQTGVLDLRPEWNGSGGNELDAWQYPFMYKPPDGYEWAMLFRIPATGDIYINSGGQVRISKGTIEAERPILIVNPTGKTVYPPGRYPWPGTATAGTRNTVREEFARQHDAPVGYGFIGWRNPVPGELFLNSKGHVEHALNGTSENRHILVNISDPDPPEVGDHKTIGADITADSPEPVAAF